MEFLQAEHVSYESLKLFERKIHIFVIVAFYENKIRLTWKRFFVILGQIF